MNKSETTRYKSPHPPPNAHQSELLIVLIEECAEVQQRATKMLRFGTQEVQPGHHLSADLRLSNEVGDLLAIVDLLKSENLLSHKTIEQAKKLKTEKLELHLQNS